MLAVEERDSCSTSGGPDDRLGDADLAGGVASPEDCEPDEGVVGQASDGCLRFIWLKGLGG